MRTSSLSGWLDAKKGAGNDPIESVVTLRGAEGIAKITKDFSFYVAPWPAEEHLQVYQSVRDIIDELDPAVVVLDTMARPTGYTPSSRPTR